MTRRLTARKREIEQCADFGDGLLQPACRDGLRSLAFETKHGVAMGGIEHFLSAVIAARMRSEHGWAIENAHVHVGSGDGQGAADGFRRNRVAIAVEGDMVLCEETVSMRSVGKGCCGESNKCERSSCSKTCATVRWGSPGQGR